MKRVSGALYPTLLDGVTRMELSRRGLIGGLASLFAAPAIVRASSLMPVKASSPPIEPLHFPALRHQREFIEMYKKTCDRLRTMTMIENRITAPVGRPDRAGRDGAQHGPQAACRERANRGGDELHRGGAVNPPVRNEERPRAGIEKHACEPRQRLGGLALTGAAGAEAVDRQPLAVTNARLALGVKSSRVGRVSHSPVSSL